MSESALALAGSPLMPASLLRRLRGTGGGSERDLVPQARLRGPMPWVVAIMVALTVLAAATGLALRNVASAARAELSGGVTVQILEAAPAARNRQAEASLALLRGAPGISAVRLVPAGEIDALLAPWLGATEGSGNADGGPNDGGDVVPVPALIDAHLDGGVSAARIAALGDALRRVAPAARLDAQASWLRPVFGAIGSLELLSLGLIGLLAGAMAATVLLAARTALGNHRGTIEIVHMLGGSDAQIARIFQRATGFDAAVGGAAGLFAALAVLLLVGRRFADLGAGIVAGGALGWVDWLLLLLVPAGGVALAMLTARLSVLSALRRML